MPKRGETKPWKMTFTWPRGIGATIHFRTQADAEDAADRQRQVIGPDGDRCVVQVWHRSDVTA